MVNRLSIVGDLNRDSLAHALAWLGGILLALTAFVQVWEIGPEMPVRLGYGQFGFNLIIFVVLLFLGGTLGGYWWRCCRWMRGECSSFLFALMIGLFGLGLVSILGFVGQYWFNYSVAGIVLTGLVYAFIFRGRKSSSSQKVGFSSGWLRNKNRWNALFFGFLFVALSANNVSALLKLDLSVAEMISGSLGRVLFSGFITGCFYVLAVLGTRAAPSVFRWLIWGILAVIPVVVIADMFLHLVYGRSLLELVNSLSATGEIDVIKELQGGGFTGISEFAVVLWLGLLVVVSVLVITVLNYVSGKLKFKMSLFKGLAVSVVFFFLSVGEQAIGMSWKRLYSWQQEYKLFMLHQGLVTPSLGLADFSVKFRSYGVSGSDFTAENNLQKELPDIHFIMVETMRHDAMSAKTTPYLMEFGKDCQQLESTWAGSNATHLSWFSIMYSKPSMFWMQDLEAIPDRSDYAGSPVLGILKDMGYSFEVRAVCDLGYKDFGLLNFGTENHLYDVMEHSVDENELTKYGIPGREKITFNRLRESVLKKPNLKPNTGGTFYFTALDSPHYNYYWDKDFAVPHSEYKDDISFPLFASKEEIRLYHNRYLNSVAWVDHQVMEFCEFLKKEGRYENSIIIVTGDHGEEFQEQGGWCHCTSIMPEQTKVPILIKWPANIAAAPSQKLASHLDIMPSVLSHLGASAEPLGKLAGKNLLGDTSDQTIIVATAFANKTGETMMLKRNGYTAYFSWSRPWEPRVPDEMRLERLVGPDGVITLKNPEDYLEKLHELFPDAFERYFLSLDIIK